MDRGGWQGTSSKGCKELDMTEHAHTHARTHARTHTHKPLLSSGKLIIPFIKISNHLSLSNQ